MKISLNTIRHANQHYKTAGDPAPDGVDALVTKIGAQLGAVEEVTRFGGHLKDVVVAKVLSCDKHPNADKLHVCMIDDGGIAKDVTRTAEGHVEVVCGAPNVRAGLTVAWLPPGTTVPSTASSKEPLVLEPREIRGVVSNGMLASAKELGISDNHDGVLEITDDVQPGTPFVEAYNLVDEAIIDIENKMFTHRPDCFGFLGVAREIEGIHGRPFKSPDWYTANPTIPDVEADPLNLAVVNELPDLVPRFVAIAMRGVTVKPSPLWLQILLAEVGVKSINNIVDYTNFFMLETGQPLHAYDYDKVKAQDAGADHATLKVRHPNEGEKIVLLGGKEVTPRKEAIMIATNDRAIGIGGVMGGAETEVDNDTKNIIIECATFDMYSIRRTAMEHGVFTDAVTRFTKGQSPLQNRAVLAKIVDEIRRYADGKVASELLDDNNVASDVMERGSLYPPVKLPKEFVNTRLGFSLSAEEMAALLLNVEFQVEVHGDDLTVQAPFWRTDIEIPEDVVEEIGRLYGFDHLPIDLPRRATSPAEHNQLISLKTQLRNMLSRAGANEVLTYSFVHGNILDKVGQNKDLAFQLSNALSPDLQYYRVSLTPSLLDKVHANVKAGYGEFALFEIGKAHVKGEPDPYEPSVPKEVNALNLVVAADDKAAQKYEGAAYYLARKYLSSVLSKEAELLFKFEPLNKADLYKNPWLEQMVAPYDPERSAVLCGEKGLIWGVIGEFKPSVRTAFKLPAYSAGFEIDPLLFLYVAPGGTTYAPLSKFPSVEQDISLKLPADAQYGPVFAELCNALNELNGEQLRGLLKPIDIYQKDDAKHFTFRLKIADYRKTLKAAEVNKLLDQLAERAKQKFQTERI